MVRGEGYTFDAPPAWEVERSEHGVSAAEGDKLVGVTTFTLRTPYSPGLWAKLVPELDRVAEDVAAKEGGELVGSRTVVVAARRARQYEIEAGGTRIQYTFLLRNRTEYQLLCRDAREVCAAFVASFRLG